MTLEDGMHAEKRVLYDTIYAIPAGGSGLINRVAEPAGVVFWRRKIPETGKWE